MLTAENIIKSADTLSSPFGIPGSWGLTAEAELYGLKSGFVLRSFAVLINSIDLLIFSNESASSTRALTFVLSASVRFNAAKAGSVSRNFISFSMVNALSY